LLGVNKEIITIGTWQITNEVVSIPINIYRIERKIFTWRVSESLLEENGTAVTGIDAGRVRGISHGGIGGYALRRPGHHSKHGVTAIIDEEWTHCRVDWVNIIGREQEEER
jgi:hypothetical protein